MTFFGVALDLADLALYKDSSGMGVGNDVCGHFNVPLQRFLGAVNHDCVEMMVAGILADLRVGGVIEMEIDGNLRVVGEGMRHCCNGVHGQCIGDLGNARKHYGRVHLFCGTDNGRHIPDVGIIEVGNGVALGVCLLQLFKNRNFCHLNASLLSF